MLGFCPYETPVEKINLMIATRKDRAYKSIRSTTFSVSGLASHNLLCLAILGTARGIQCC